MIDPPLVSASTPDYDIGFRVAFCSIDGEVPVLKNISYEKSCTMAEGGGMRVECWTQLDKQSVGIFSDRDLYQKPEIYCLTRFPQVMNIQEIAGDVSNATLVSQQYSNEFFVKINNLAMKYILGNEIWLLAAVLSSGLRVVALFNSALDAGLCNAMRFSLDCVTKWPKC